MQHGEHLVLRVGGELRALAAATGQPIWQAAVDDSGGAGSFVHAYNDVILTDRRPDPLRLTELVAVQAGKVSFTLGLGCIVDRGASLVAAGIFYAIGNAPDVGPVLRAVNLATRKLVVDVPLRAGADMLEREGDRLLVGNRMASPGLYWLQADGSGLTALESAPAQEMRTSGGRVLAALREHDTDAPTRTAQVRDLASGKVLWSTPAQGPVIGLDGDSAVHYEGEGEQRLPVLREAASGKLRWRGPAVEDPSRVSFAGPYVFLGHMTGNVVHRRDDGSLLGALPLSRTALEASGSIVIGGFKFLAAFRP
ncbi:MAG: hypothetical protein IT370_34860 [Deltaproteobacteria bacterium]|nr:hypothetical protein [Deltaproteobacteria bacterium]